jgi:PAS domain S-box-containing protein
MKGYLKNMVPLGLTVSLFLLGATAWMSYRTSAEQTDTAEWVTHTHIVLERLEGLLAEVLKAESSRRGFVLSKDKQFLEQFSVARSAIQKTEEELRPLTADNATQQKKLDMLEPLIEARVRLLEQSTDRLQAGDLNLRLEAVVSIAGASATRQIEAVIKEMENAEKQLLVQRNAAARNSAERMKIVLLGGTLVSIVILLGVFTLLNREVAERTRAEEDLNRFFNVSADMMCVAGTNGYFKRLNPAWEKTLGYSVAELLARPYLDFVHPDDLPATQTAAQAASAAGLASFENRYRTKQGTFRWLNWNSSPDQQRGVIYAAARDVTDRKRAEAKLVESEERFRIMVEGVKDFAIFLLDTEGRVATWNAGAQRLKGYQAEEILGKNFSCFYPQEEIDRGKPAMELRMAAESGRFEEEGWRVRKDGSKLWANVIITRLQDQSGTMLGFSKLTQDFTERKRTAENIRLLNEDLERRSLALEESNKELEAFTYSVSHDLRAPLRHVDGFSRLLLEEHGEQLDPEGKRMLERVRQGTQHMGALVDDLLNLSRVSRREVNPLVTDLNTIVEEVLTELKPTCQDRQVEFRAGRLPFAQCDPGLIRQVFANLLSNAIKFTRPRESAIIEVGQTLQDGHDVLYVRDNGVGFSMKYADKLFGVFQRLHRAEDFEGTGVGLATVQRIIQKHSGRIWVEAEIDKGAAFYFTLEGMEDTHSDNTGMAKEVRTTKG